MDLPKALVDQVREGQVVLFLGSGAVRGALHPENRPAPVGSQLADLIADEFLDSTYRGRPLDQVATLAISERDLVTVQRFLAKLLSEYRPAPFHRKIPQFVWRLIATTNYDIVIERAYDEETGRCQQLVPFIHNGQHVEERLRDSASLPYLKLHGCVTRHEDASIPLILTPEQYITHRQNRSRLFERLKEAAFESPFVFAGYSIADIDIRAILLELAQLGDAMPRSYYVAPNIAPADVRYWSSRRLTCLPGTLEDFLGSLDSAITKPFRRIAASMKSTHPIGKWLGVAPETKLTSGMISMLERDFEYIHGGLSSGALNASLFYRGYLPDWAPIAGGCDVRRSLANSIVSEVVLPVESERAYKQELVLIKGHAGSGKSILLHRVAWEAAVEYDQLCLYVKPGGDPKYETIAELARLSRRRIFLFIEPASDFRDCIRSIIDCAKRDGHPITIVTAERQPQWAGLCDGLDPLVTKTYELGYLNLTEIDELLILLERHKSLGHLATLTTDQRRSALAERAGRQLLVALHEATFGKPFSDIVLDEYESIPDANARTVYRSVCILHRLNVTTRAGLLARVHGISLSSFKERLFQPLEGIVFARYDPRIRDFVYETRHPHVADMVFERVLVDAADRLEEYLRIVGGLDVDYSSDSAGLRGLTKAKELQRLFSEIDMVRRVFRSACGRDPSNALLLQQHAIAEMAVENFDAAIDLLNKARTLKPNFAGIEHSLAELYLKKSASARTDIERRKYRNDARVIADKLINRGPVDSHPYHTLLKIEIEELGEAMTGDDPPVAAHVRRTEALLTRALQRFPGDEYLLDAEAKFSKLFRDSPRAMAALKRAYGSSQKSPYIATRLAGLHEEQGDIPTAIGVLKDCLKANPRDKDMHYRLGRLLEKDPESNRDEVRYHFREAFTRGDSRFEAQFWYARAEYLFGEVAVASDIFRGLASAGVPSRQKWAARGKVAGRRFAGSVDRTESSFGFIRKDGDGARVYMRPDDCESAIWLTLTRHTRVSFDLAFNFAGPIAISIRPEK